MFGSAPSGVLLPEEVDGWGAIARKQEIGFLYAPLCSLHLPRSGKLLVDGQDYVRAFGKFSLILQPGYLDLGNGPTKQPLPFGPVARQLMLAINTRAIVNDTPTVTLGSARSLLTEMGHDGGGRRYMKLQSTLRGLISMHMTVTDDSGSARKLRIVSDSDAWIPSSGGRWCEQLLLSNEYWAALRDKPTPIDVEAVTALRGSSLAIDLYTWLTIRLRLIPPNNPLHIGWSALRAQFGPDYGDIRNFRKDFNDHFAQAVAAYRPSPRFKTFPAGLKLWHSPPPVSRRKLGRTL